MANVTVDMELNVRAFNNALKDATKATDSFSKNATSGFNKSSAAFGSFIGNLGATAVTAAFRGLVSLGGAVIDFGKSSIEAASKMEDLETQFKTLTNSSSQAKKIMKDLTEFAASTPFQLEGLANVSSQLLAFGFEVDEIQDKLRRIGDVASASGAGLGELGTIFGQVSAAGKLTGERLNQLQEKGIPVMSALASEMKVAESAVRDLVSKGKVDFATFEAAFNSMSDAGGFAFEGMIAKSKTFSGVMSTLGDNWTLFSAEIGKALLPIAKGLATVAIQTIQSFDINVIKAWIKDGILVAVDALIAFTDYINPIIKGFQFLWNAAQITFKAIELLINGAAATISAVWAAEIETILWAVKKLPDAIVPDSWLENLETLAEAMGETNDQIVDDVGETALSIIGDFEDIGNSLENNVVSTAQIDAIKKRLEDAKKAVLKSNKEIDKEENKVAKKKSADIAKEAEEYKNHHAGLFATKKAWGESTTAWEKLNSQQKESNLKSSLGTISTLTSSNNKELFFVGKAAAVANATIDGIAATQKALASAPPPFNFVLAGLVGAASAVNIANIASSQPPRFERGGIVSGTNFAGDSINARVNSGEMILNRSQQANLFGQINSGAAGGNTDALLVQLIDTVASQRNTSIEIDGREIFNVVREQTDRGRTL